MSFQTFLSGNISLSSGNSWSTLSKVEVEFIKKSLNIIYNCDQNYNTCYYKIELFASKETAATIKSSLYFNAKSFILLRPPKLRQSTILSNRLLTN